MPQFVLIARDATDADAFERRMKARGEHLAAIAQYRAKGNILCGLALLGDDGKMNGSVIVTNFPTRADFDAWLLGEPFMTHKVWEDIKVLDASLAPTFSDLVKD